MKPPKFEHRHLDHAPEDPIETRGLAAIDDLLDRGDFASWQPLAAAIRADPHGRLADQVLGLCDAHPMYGTSALWRTWIEGLRSPLAGLDLAHVRRARGLTQVEVAARMGVGQSDVSRIERRSDVRLSSLRAYAEALGGTVQISFAFPDEPRSRDAGPT